MEPELAALCTQTVTIAPYSGQNANGEASWGAAVSYQAQISGENRMVRNSQGQEVVSTLTVILSQYVSVSTKDRITLPATYTPQTPPILMVEKFQDEGATHHTTLRLQ